MNLTYPRMRRVNWRFPLRFWLTGIGEAIGLVAIFAFAFAAATFICAMGGQ